MRVRIVYRINNVSRINWESTCTTSNPIDVQYSHRTATFKAFSAGGDHGVYIRWICLQHEKGPHHEIPLLEDCFDISLIAGYRWARSDRTVAMQRERGPQEGKRVLSYCMTSLP